VGADPDGTPCYEIEVYSPEIRRLRQDCRQVSGMPVVTYG
jgi:hypothetical protein